MIDLRRSPSAWRVLALAGASHQDSWIADRSRRGVEAARQRALLPIVDMR